MQHNAVRLRDERTLGYAQYGEPGGMPVFLFQGTPSSRLMHPDETITRRLRVRLITIHRPGFGLSSFQAARTFLDWPDDVSELAGRLGIDRFTLLPGKSACWPIPEALGWRIARC